MSGITNWDDVMKKEARGIDDYDLGEVHDLDADTVVTKKELLTKTNSICQKTEQCDSMDIKFDFNVTKDEAKAFKRD